MTRTEYADLEVMEASPAYSGENSPGERSPGEKTLRNFASVPSVMTGGMASSTMRAQMIGRDLIAPDQTYTKLKPVSERVLHSETEVAAGGPPAEFLRAATTEPATAESESTDAAVSEEGARNLRSAAQHIWKRCLETLRSQLSAQTMRTWFEPLEGIGLEGTALTLRAPSNFFCEWISEHYEDALQSALRDVLGATAEFRFETTSELDSLNTKLEPAQAPSPNAPSTQTLGQRSSGQQANASPFAHAATPRTQASQQHGGLANAPQQTSKRPAIEPNLNPRYTFETFIRGESNKLAYAAANAVANNPGGTRYNPLVIYGNVGLGKTHLIQAVGNAALQKFPTARVLYTSSDRFTVEFVDSIQNDRINEFQSLYRSIDVLIIDDVQFFAGKEKTQDIFFHTFNALRELGKQIILTCDRAPKELKDIDDRLLNRLQWGLTADIGAPDLETRIAILRHKAIADGVDLSSDIVEFIASNVTTNIRELEGCLISLLATASLEGKEPTLDLAREVLRKVAKRSTPMLTIETIQRAVSKKFGVEEELLRAKTRKQEIVQARQVAMFLAKELTNHSLKSIGLHFGGRDHSTVIHAVQAVVDDMRHDAALTAKIEDLRRQFEMMH